MEHTYITTNKILLTIRKIMEYKNLYAYTVFQIWSAFIRKTVIGFVHLGEITNLNLPLDCICLVWFLR